MSSYSVVLLVVYKYTFRGLTCVITGNDKFPASQTRVPTLPVQGYRSGIPEAARALPAGRVERKTEGAIVTQGLNSVF